MSEPLSHDRGFFIKYILSIFRVGDYPPMEIKGYLTSTYFLKKS